MNREQVPGPRPQITSIGTLSFSEYLLLGHITNLKVNAGLYEAAEQRMLSAYNNPNVDPNLTVEEDIIGLSGIAKSAIRWEETKRKSHFGPTYTWDYELAIAIAEKQGVSTRPSGSREPEDFEYANKVDNKVMDLFLEYIPGRKFLIREKPAIPQDPIRKTGVTKGDWDHDRRDAHPQSIAQVKRVIFELLIGGDEELRRSNFWRRDELVRASAIKGDQNRASPLAAGIQHLMAIVDIMWDLIDNKQLGDSSRFYSFKTRRHLEDHLNPGITPSRDAKGKVIIDSPGFPGQPETIVEIVRDIIPPRIGLYVHGDPATQNITYLHNEFFPGWRGLESHSKDKLDKQYGIHRALMDYAASTRNSALMTELKRLKIPQILRWNGVILD